MNLSVHRCWFVFPAVLKATSPKWSRISTMQRLSFKWRASLFPKISRVILIWPLLKGEKPKDWRTSLYYHFYEYPAEHAVKRHYGVRTDRYKLIHFYNDIDVWELYDLQNDPMEMHNIYNEPAMKP